MKILVAIDSFKGSLTSFEAGEAVALGIKRVDPLALVEVLPIADGGEGTVDALVYVKKGKKHIVEVQDPLGRTVRASYGIIDGNTAVIEMSSAAGITLLTKSELNPLYTTTYGVGEMIKDAIYHGCRNFIIGIGGSATNDGGVGMLQALGFGILDKNGEQVPLGAVGLKDVVKITADCALPVLSECVFNIACDVTNPLCFENGCSVVFARQKGADDEMIKAMDGWLFNYAKLVKTIFPDSDMNASGAGAAGGLGFAFMSFLNGKLVSGIDLVLTETGIEDRMKGADIVFTGEGKLDSQTVMGKAPYGVTKIAKKYGKPVIALSGCVSKDASVCNQNGIDAFFSVVRGVCSEKEAMDKENAFFNTADTAEQVFRLINIKI